MPYTRTPKPSSRTVLTVWACFALRSSTSRVSYRPEEELFSELQHLVAPLREKPVTIRLLDIGGDKAIPSLRLPFESNPLLGKRGVRVLLDYPQLARAQLKSLLRLSQTQDIRILVPMVTFERDMQQIRELLVAVAREMGIQKLPPLGAMIETPAAALTVGQIARHADFFRGNKRPHPVHVGRRAR